MEEDRGRKGKFNTKTFAIKDQKGRIWVAVPVLLYRDGDAGYAEMSKYFTTMMSDDAVTLNSEWCEILPMNSSTNEGRDDDDD